MNRNYIFFALMLAAMRTPAATEASNATPDNGKSISTGDDFQREKLNFNQGWKFIRKNVPAAVDPAYSIKELEHWESVALPHNVRVEPYISSSKN